MKSIQIQFGQAEGRPTGLQNGAQKGSQNGIQKSPEMEAFREPPGARNALFSYWFRTKTAPTGPWKCSENECQRGSKKKPRTEPKWMQKSKQDL